MFGYATNETATLMPLTHVLSTQLCQVMADKRKSKAVPWLRPDVKTQVTVEYKKEANNSLTPVRVHTVVISTQHAPDVTNEEIRKGLMEIIKEVIPAKYLDDKTLYHLNPSGRFVIGGPQGKNTFFTFENRNHFQSD